MVIIHSAILPASTSIFFGFSLQKNIKNATAKKVCTSKSKKEPTRNEGTKKNLMNLLCGKETGEWPKAYVRNEKYRLMLTTPLSFLLACHSFSHLFTNAGTLIKIFTTFFESETLESFEEVNRLRERKGAKHVHMHACVYIFRSVQAHQDHLQKYIVQNVCCAYVSLPMRIIIIANHDDVSAAGP